MKILCQKCRKEFEISKDQIIQMRKNIIGDITPLDYLDYFHNLSGRCEKGKRDELRHDFVWSLDFCEEIKKLIRNNRDLNGRHDALILTEKKIDDTIVQLKQKLEELEQKKIDLEKDKETIKVEQDNLLMQAEELTGSVDLAFWEKGKIEEKV